MFKSLQSFVKKHSLLFELLLIVIITVPAFMRLLNTGYFPMHDDQHIARLFLLDQGLRAGSFYPRWVDMLGFGYGYPLFNFYPPLIYFVAEVFHLVGFSLIWSIKLTFVTGFILGALGMYLLAKKIVGRAPAFLASTLYTYFFYHAVTSYVRGALSEFFSMAVLPFVFLSIFNLSVKQNPKRSIFFGACFGLLILTHPLIAFPSLFYIGFFFLFYLFQQEKKARRRFFIFYLFGLVFGLCLSMFFWLPSYIERKYTMTNSILTTELASYKIHYVYPQQLWQSLWGYGGSISGPYDGLTFQLGLFHLLFLFFSIISFLAYLFIQKKDQKIKSHFLFFLLLSAFSVFMTTQFSGFIWDRISYLWFLQFPWRFLTFAGVFMALSASYWILFLKRVFISKEKLKVIIGLLTVLSIILIIVKYQKYFSPAKSIYVSDSQLTSLNEITWRVSRSSFEFIPREVATKKSELNTTIPEISKDDLPMTSFLDLSRGLSVNQKSSKPLEKIYTVYNKHSLSPLQINIFYFPGWSAYLDGRKIDIDASNKLRLIHVMIPSGNHVLRVVFEDTAIRKISDGVSLIALVFGCLFLILSKLKKVKG